MRTSLRVAAAFIVLGLWVACSLFESGILWQDGPYVLRKTDKAEDVQLFYSAGSGVWLKRVGPTVFSVGYDGDYVVAKQHPAGDKSITNYFIVDAQRDSLSVEARDVVIGPLSEYEFKEKAQELNLPPFSKVIESLK